MFATKDENFVKRYNEEMYQKKVRAREKFFSVSLKRRLAKIFLKYGIGKSFFRRNCPYSYGKICKETNYFTNEKIAVYTGVFGGYDQIYTPGVKPDNIDYYIFSDDEIENSVWMHRTLSLPIELEGLTNAEKNRYVKMHPHALFPEYKYSIYVDGSIEINTDLTEFIYKLNRYGFALHEHYERNCVYSEIEECIKQKKCSIDELQKYRQKLIDEGFPREFGLLEAPVLVRDHCNDKCISLMENWWNEYMTNVKRDQIALIYQVWKMSISPKDLATLGNDVHADYAFTHHSHKAR